MKPHGTTIFGPGYATWTHGRAFRAWGCLPESQSAKCTAYGGLNYSPAGRKLPTVGRKRIKVQNRVCPNLEAMFLNGNLWRASLGFIQSLSPLCHSAPATSGSSRWTPRSLTHLPSTPCFLPPNAIPERINRVSNDFSQVQYAPNHYLTQYFWLCEAPLKSLAARPKKNRAKSMLQSIILFLLDGICEVQVLQRVSPSHRAQLVVRQIHRLVRFVCVPLKFCRWIIPVCLLTFQPHA
jgi:hypothetical protein